MQMALRLMSALSAAIASATSVEPALAQTAYGQTYAPAAAVPASPQAPMASALPPPPYAAALANSAVRYGGVQAYDRYGGETRHAAIAGPSSVNPSPTATAGAFAGARLSWSGKVDGPAATRPAPVAYAQAPAPYGPPTPVQAQSAPAPRGWTYMPPIGQGAGGPVPAPLNSIYDPAPAARQPSAAAPAPVQVAQGQTEGGARHYSVHRDYGIAPDPIPLPPQFFGATADLSQPATSDPIRRATTAAGKAQNPLQPADGQ